jgi:hypothetical protein
LKVQPGHADAWIGLANLKIERFSASDVTRLQAELRSPLAPLPARIALGFTLAQAQEDQADYAAAFDTLERANALKRRHLNWDAAAARAYTQSIREAFAQPSSCAADERLGEEVIFIACLPRSGATLTEQILASHPQVEGADVSGHLQNILDEESERRRQAFPQWTASATCDDWARLGRDYLARTERWRRQRTRFIDRNPLNWRLVGAAMAMLPGARVIDSRRDALENCLSCYRQWFATGSQFTYDLDELAAYWHDYDQLSRHWKKIFPQRFLEHSYEALLTGPEAQVRRLLDFCGLDFDPACLEFHRTRRTVHGIGAALVREPLQHRVARGTLYHDRLQRLRELLKIADRSIQRDLASA